MAKLPARFNTVALPLVLSGLMSLIVSGVSTWRAVGVPANFLGLWLNAWAWSWLIAFPAVMVVLPIARRIVARVVEQPSLPR